MGYEIDLVLTGTPHETIPTKVSFPGLLMSTNGPPVSFDYYYENIYSEIYCLSNLYCYQISPESPKHAPMPLALIVQIFES